MDTIEYDFNVDNDRLQENNFVKTTVIHYLGSGEPQDRIDLLLWQSFVQLLDVGYAEDHCYYWALDDIKSTIRRLHAQTTEKPADLESLEIGTTVDDPGYWLLWQWLYGERTTQEPSSIGYYGNDFIGYGQPGNRWAHVD